MEKSPRRRRAPAAACAGAPSDAGRESALATREEIAEERRRARALRLVADTTAAVLRQARLDRSQAEALVAATRRRALQLFPGRERAFDLILAPRFARIVEERFGSRGAEVIPFPGSEGHR